MPARLPLVAIVTPVHNGARFLEEAIASVQAQTYPNCVHLLLDNASRDATPEIIARSQGGRVPIIAARHETLLEMAANWNRALGMTPPEAAFFRVLCADDVLSPDYVSKTVAVFERHAAVVAVGCQLNHRGKRMRWGWEPHREHFSGREAIARFFGDSGVIIAHQVLFRREVLDWRTPFFESGMAACDTDACLDILRRGDWGFVHEVLAVTRDHEDTDTNKTVKPLRLDKAEQLILLQRHGEFGLGKVEAAAAIANYRRHYVRHLMLWTLLGKAGRVQRHLRLLNDFGVTLSFADGLDAVAHWLSARVGQIPPEIAPAKRGWRRL